MSGGKIANTMPATGADRTTGATDEQIDTAVQHWFASFGAKLSRIQTEGARDQRDAFRFAAEHLIPSGYAMPDSERMSPELKAAIGRTVKRLDEIEVLRTGVEIEDAMDGLDALRSILVILGRIATTSDLALLRHAAEGGTT